MNKKFLIFREKPYLAESPVVILCESGESIKNPPVKQGIIMNYPATS